MEPPVHQTGLPPPSSPSTHILPSPVSFFCFAFTDAEDPAQEQNQEPKEMVPAPIKTETQ